MPTFNFSPRFVNSGNLSHSYSGVPCTPSDSTDLPVGPNGPTTPCSALAVTGAGNVAVQLASGGTATLTGLGAGQVIDVGVKRVLATGTTATGIFACYAEPNR